MPARPNAMSSIDRRLSCASRQRPPAACLVAVSRSSFGGVPGSANLTSAQRFIRRMRSSTSGRTARS